MTLLLTRHMRTHILLIPNARSRRTNDRHANDADESNVDEVRREHFRRELASPVGWTSHLVPRSACRNRGKRRSFFVWLGRWSRPAGFEGPGARGVRGSG